MNLAVVVRVILNQFKTIYMIDDFFYWKKLTKQLRRFELCLFKLQAPLSLVLETVMLQAFESFKLFLSKQGPLSFQIDFNWSNFHYQFTELNENES